MSADWWDEQEQFGAPVTDTNPDPEFDLTEHAEHHRQWSESEDRRHAESEAMRMYPDGLHLGKFDGLMSDAEIDRRMLIQRQAYIQGRQHQFKRERGMTV